MSAAAPLLVFAHRDEASAFADLPHLVTGIGKINAAVALATALASDHIERVIVLGTAGVVGDGDARLDLDTVVQVTEVVQHDFSLPSPALRPSGEHLLPPSQHAVMATGDAFVKDDAQRAHIAGLGAGLVDMEGYAYAAVCARLDVPLQIFKIPSDFADSSTTDEEWDEIVFRKSEQLRAFWDDTLR
ncbi:MAG: purine-nucleoside phosphorylase [Leucobacter sp.]